MANEAFLMSFHRDLLSDTDTQRRFRKAIRTAVREGDVVLDLGAGTGVHAIFACEAGAARVYAVESDRIIDLAREIVERNGYRDRVTFVEGRSTEIDLPERVDLLVANLGFDSTIRYLPDARDRFLKPRGRLIPDSMELAGAPVESPGSHTRDVAFWREGCLGVELEPMWKVAANTVHVDRFATEQLLSRPQTLVRVAMGETDGRCTASHASWTVRRTGVMHGMASWYVQHLDDETDVSLAPPLQLPYPLWHHGFFPLREPVPVEEGDRVEAEIRLAPYADAGTYLTWELRVEGRQVSLTSTHSTLEGTPLSREALERGLPHYRPKLGPRGKAARVVLELVDRRRTLESIEAETCRRFPGLFRERRDAAAFVSRVLREYGS
jgi:protein arginine N-methyltransferase 1